MPGPTMFLNKTDYLRSKMGGESTKKGHTHTPKT